MKDDLKPFFYNKLHTEIYEDGKKEEFEEVSIKKEYESLINFLNSTKRYAVDNLAPYMYLAQDEISIKTGDEINRKLVAAMRSKNVKAVRNIIRENKNIEVAINYELETVIDIVDMANDIITIINSFDILEKSKEEISNIISEKLFDVLDTLKADWHFLTTWLS